MTIRATDALIYRKPTGEVDYAYVRRDYRQAATLLGHMVWHRVGPLWVCDGHPHYGFIGFEPLRNFGRRWPKLERELKRKRADRAQGSRGDE